MVWSGVLVSRHQLLPAPKKALEELGIEIVYIIEYLNRAKDAVNIAKELGAKYIVVQTTPPGMLMKLWQMANRNGIAVLVLKHNCLGLYRVKEEAEEKIRGREDRAMVMPSPEGTFRVVEFKGITKLKRIYIEEEYIWPQKETSAEKVKNSQVMA